jgi:signal transduction histidine kinase
VFCAKLARVAGLRSLAARSARCAAALLGLGLGIAALALLHRHVPPVSYAATSTTGAFITAAAGFALIASGLVVGLGARVTWVGDLALVAGIMWFAPLWVGWPDGPPFARSVAMPLSALTFPVLVHLVLAFPAGLRNVGERTLVATIYIETVLAGTAAVLLGDPYLDARCWANCTVNVFLIRPEPTLVRGVGSVDRVFILLAALVLGVLCTIQVARSTRAVRRQRAAVLVAAVAFSVSILAKMLRLQQTNVEDPFDHLLYTAFVVQGISLVALSAGLAWSVVRPHLIQRALSKIVTSIEESPRPGSLETALGTVLGDPDLRLHYWLPETQRYVDSTGRPSPVPEGSSGLSLTRLERDGQLLAIVSHAMLHGQAPPQLGPALLLGLENERLQAEVLGQLESLRASRTRVVQTADVERRQLERDLHDGAQQHLLALSYDLRVARASAHNDADQVTETHLSRAVGHAQAALEELRELAHGIYPTILERSGLVPAVASLADTASIVVQIRGADLRRYPPHVEAAAYFAVRESLDNATARQAHHATVTFIGDDRGLKITIDDDGSADDVKRSTPMMTVADRVGALGGSLRLEPTTCIAVIPCE